jgi:ABC-type uncharacterized transport system fused permease/ATPase subunit
MYYSLTATFQYLAILQRLSDILMMEDVKKSRMNEDVKPSDVCIELKEADFSWGFDLDQNIQSKNISQVQPLQEDKVKPVVKGATFSLGSKDLLVVAGRVGSGKTSLLLSIMDETE